MIHYKTLFYEDLPSNIPKLWDEKDITDLITANIDTLKQSFAAAMDAAMQGYPLSHDAPLSSVYISWLRSSALFELPLLRIDFYDSNGLGDLQECSSTWDISFISKHIYSRLPVPAGRIERGDLTPYDMEKIRIFEAEKLCAVLKDYISEITEPLRQTEKYKKIAFYYGQFLDEYKLIDSETAIPN